MTRRIPMLLVMLFFSLAVLVLTACGSPVQVTSNVNAAGVRPGNNVVAFMGDDITAMWPNLPTTDINVGVDGNTTAQMQARFTADVIDRVPGIVVIQGGINDLIQGADSIANIAKMAAEAKQQDMRVIIAAVLPQDQDVFVTAAQIEAFNQQLLALAQSNGYQYADYYDALLDASGRPDDSLLTDGLHPNAAGYRALWDALEPLILEAQS